MRIVELLNKIQIPLNNEEWAVLSLFNESNSILKSDLDERGQLLANQLVNKDILSRQTNAEGKLEYHKKIR